jgi:anti-sigma B factor antagonist
MPISRSVQLEPLASGVGPVFAITVGNYHGVAVLSVVGDLDLLTADQFDRSLASVIYDEVTLLVVDLSETTFMGTCTMTTLLRVHQGLQDARGQVVVVARGPATARPLRMAGLSDSIFIVDSIHAALDGTARAHRDPQRSDREVLPLRKRNEEDVPR